LMRPMLFFLLRGMATRLLPSLSALIIFFSIALVSTGILTALEGPAELGIATQAARQWDAQDTQRAEAVAALTEHLALDTELLSNLTLLNQRLVDAAGPRPKLDQNWTFIGSLYFVFTIVTTIGYGTFAPQTDSGRAYTVLLGFFGTVSFALVVDKLVSHFKDVMSWTCGKLGVRSTSRQAAVRVVAIMLYWVVGAIAFDALAKIEGDRWSVGISLYYAATTFLTIGLGDYSLRWYGPVAVLEVLGLWLFATTGLVLFVELASVLSDQITAIRDVSACKRKWRTSIHTVPTATPMPTQ